MTFLDKAGGVYPTVDEVLGSGISKGGLELQGGAASTFFSPLVLSEEPRERTLGQTM